MPRKWHRSKKLGNRNEKVREADSPMKCVFISYLNPFKFSGGGEAISRTLIECGLKLGHSIEVVSAFPELTGLIPHSFDLAILVDIHNAPKKWRRFPEAMLREVMKGAYVHIDHAYVDLCNLDYLPCNGAVPSDHVCIFRNILGVTWPQACYAQQVKDLYRNSLMNVFHSPLHLRVVQDILGKEVIGRSFIIRPTVDPSQFYNMHLDRDIEYLCAGVVCEAKGYEIVKERFAGKTVHFVGPIRRGTRFDFGVHLGQVPYGEMPRLFNRVRHFINLPRWPEPCGRVIVEAALCGCDLITNENVGAVSFDFDICDPKNLAGSAEEFWTQLQSCTTPRAATT